MAQWWPAGLMPARSENRSAVKNAKLVLMSTVGTLAALAGMVSGCSQVEKITNQGGDTKCSDFLTADEKKQNEAINKMLKDEGKNEPANLELTGTRLAIRTYCQTVGKQDTKISEAPHL
jgi:acid stress chaperone HdeA